MKITTPDFNPGVLMQNKSLAISMAFKTKMASHSFPKIWIHAVFGTKNRAKLITNDNESKIHNYLKTYLKDDLGCEPRIVNGSSEHIHALFLMNHQRSISEIMKNLKGGSSHWINQNKLSKGRFAWQTGYGAFSVS